MANTNIHDTHLEAPEILRGATSSKATSYKLQATSSKQQAGRRPAPGRGWGTGALPKRGWEIRALRQPQPPAKYTGFSRINQQAFCRRYLGTLERF